MAWMGHGAEGKWIMCESGVCTSCFGFAVMACRMAWRGVVMACRAG